MFRTALPLLLAGAGSALAALQVDFISSTSIKAAAKDVAFDVMSYYKGNQSGEILGLLSAPPPSGAYYWWNSAVLWSTIIDYYRYTADDTYNTLAVQGLTAQNGGGLDHPFLPANWTPSAGNDDQGFWGIAALQAAELTFPSPPKGQPSWIDLAKAVFDTQAARYAAEKDTCNGGLRWQLYPTNAGYTYKNTISNAVFLNLGARLARYTGNQTYADWAEKTWTWLATTGLIDDQSNVFDGTYIQNNCTQITKFQWSYTAGVLLQSAAYMYNHTTDTTQKTWLTRLTSLTNRTITLFAPNTSSPLTEIACENSPASADDATACDTDMRLFKGITLRALASAAQLAEPVHDTIVRGVLEPASEAAVKTCDGGVRGRECGFRWGAEKGVKITGVGEEMNALSAVLGRLVWEGGVVGTADVPGQAAGGGSGTGSGTGSSSGSTTGGGGSAGSGGSGNSGSAVRVGMGLLAAGLFAALM